MTRLNNKYVVNDNGPRAAVRHHTDDYAKKPEQQEALRAYDAAKSSGDDIIPFEQALEEMQRQPS